MSATALLLLLAIGLVDAASGAELSVGPLYLAPVLLLSWRHGFGAGAAAAALSAVILLVAESYSDPAYEYAATPYWNMAMWLAVFLLAAYLTSRLRAEQESEAELTRTDALTGLASASHFYDETRLEIRRAARYDRPFSIAYLDVDDFKSINSRFDRKTGDDVLREIGQALRASLRDSDTAARLGADEFALLLPETTGDAARTVLDRVRDNLNAAVRRHGWPVTFSIGAATYLTPPRSMADALRNSDGLLYSVKASGKDAIQHEIYRDPAGIVQGPAARH